MDRLARGAALECASLMLNGNSACLAGCGCWPGGFWCHHLHDVQERPPVSCSAYRYDTLLPHACQLQMDTPCFLRCAALTCQSFPVWWCVGAGWRCPCVRVRVGASSFVQEVQNYGARNDCQPCMRV